MTNDVTTTEAVEASEAPASTAHPSAGSRLRRLLRTTERWRRTRPFWGALILGAGGYYVLNPMIGASMQMVVHMGMRGAAVYLLSGGMVLAAVIALVTPAQRHFPAVMAMACSVLSLPFANLGGWIIGMVLGIVGSGMVFAWTPYTDKQLARIAEKAARKVGRRSARRALRAGGQPVAG